jgi:hypothetical protein
MTSPSIGTLNENPLHAALKKWYARPEDQIEVPLAGYVIDIVRDGQLIEIQTGNFGAIRRKLVSLATDHPLRLVHPIPRFKWIVKLGDEGQTLSRRKSPKQGRLHDIFAPLVSIPQLIEHPNFEIEVLLVDLEETRRYDGKRGWRRGGWVIDERRLLDVVAQQRLCSAQDLMALLPPLPDLFTTADLAEAAGTSRRIAQKTVYCLRIARRIQIVGKQGNTLLYQRSQGMA